MTLSHLICLDLCISRYIFFKYRKVAEDYVAIVSGLVPGPILHVHFGYKIPESEVGGPKTCLGLSELRIRCGFGPRSGFGPDPTSQLTPDRIRILLSKTYGSNQFQNY